MNPPGYRRVVRRARSGKRPSHARSRHHPLLPAVSLGIICGIIAATLQLEGGPTTLVALAGAAAVVFAGVGSVFGTRGEGSEKAVVAALVWLALALASGLALTRFRVRDRQGAARKDAGQAA